MILFSKKKPDYGCISIETHRDRLADTKLKSYAKGFETGFNLGKKDKLNTFYFYPDPNKDGLSIKVSVVDETPKIEPVKYGMESLETTKKLSEELKLKDSDSVNHPKHYTDGKIEVIEYIEDKKLGFCLGNAVKYISRAGKKDPYKEVEDLMKAVWYIKRRITEIKEGG